jgi:hypothetical protein
MAGLMASAIETRLIALQELIEDATDLTVARNEVLPTDIPADGLLILRDGDPGEPETTLSPMTWHYEHAAELELITQGPDRETTFDDLKVAIGAGVAADRTLGGLCDWIEADAPAPVEEPVFGADTIKAAVIIIRLSFATTDPLG